MVSIEATADQIVAAVVPGKVLATTGSLPPLPMVDLQAVSRDDSVAYAMARIDRSGVIAAKSTLDALDWQPGDPIGIEVRRNLLVFCRSDGSSYALPKKRAIVLPASARNACRVHSGDSVLLAAAPQHGILVAYTRSAINEIIKSYHETRRLDEPS